MNGTDWPSPSANLSTVEDHIKKIVAATGVDVPSLVTGGLLFFFGFSYYMKLDYIKYYIFISFFNFPLFYFFGL